MPPRRHLRKSCGWKKHSAEPNRPPKAVFAIHSQDTRAGKLFLGIHSLRYDEKLLCMSRNDSLALI